MPLYYEKAGLIPDKYKWRSKNSISNMVMFLQDTDNCSVDKKYEENDVFGCFYFYKETQRKQKYV